MTGGEVRYLLAKRSPSTFYCLFLNWKIWEILFGRFWILESLKWHFLHFEERFKSFEGYKIPYKIRKRQHILGLNYFKFCINLSVSFLLSQFLNIYS